MLSSGFTNPSAVVRYMTIGVAGAFAGAMETMVLAPMDAFKVRLQQERLYKTRFLNKMRCVCAREEKGAFGSSDLIPSAPAYSEAARAEVASLASVSKNVYRTVMSEGPFRAWNATFLRQMLRCCNMYSFFRNLSSFSSPNALTL